MENNEKQVYENPEIEVTEFNAEDIITTSTSPVKPEVDNDVDFGDNNWAGGI